MAGDDRHRELMTAAINSDAEAQRALLAGDIAAARASFTAAAEQYRKSWEAAPPRSYGRLVGMLKSAVLARRGDQYVDYVRRAIADDEVTSPPAAYARALAALISEDADEARRWAAQMRCGPDAFVRAADAITALAARDQPGYAKALAAIVGDFEQRQEHLTGVPIADTALMLEELGARRGISARVSSPLLPAAGDSDRSLVRVRSDDDRVGDGNDLVDR